jgi:hypothetical protein
MRNAPLLFVLVAVMLSHCREPFEPDFKTGINDYLVVEGFIRVGTKEVTTIRLSRVSPLDNGGIPANESDAQLQIESEDGDRYILQETSPGTYKSDSLTLDADTKFHLLIERENGLEYASSFSNAIPTPGIDSVHWDDQVDGVHIYVSTHGDVNDSRFYSWTYMETWEIRSDHDSDFQYVGGIVKRRSNAETSAMRFCWKYWYPEDLHIASNEQLTENIMHYSLTTFGHFDERILSRYSILAEQRSLVEDEYRYLQLIQKNSTNTGSLFDPMPSEIHGNITCTTDRDIPAIGFVSASIIKYKRIFILPSEIDGPKPNKCKTEIVTEDNFASFFGALGFLPVDSLGIDLALDPEGRPVYTGAPTYCMDCRFRGTPKRPDFW